MDRESQKQNRKHMWVTLGLIATVFVIAFVVNYLNSTRLQRAVRNHHRSHGVSYVTLGELMNFEWDRALYFYRLPSSAWIYDVFGVGFGGARTDLTIGIVFFNGNTIAYYELFQQTWRGMDATVSFDILTDSITRTIYPDDVLRVVSRNHLAVLVNERLDPLQEEALRSELLLEFGDVFELTARTSNRNRKSVTIRFNNELPLEEFQETVKRSRLIAINALESSKFDSLGITVSLRGEHNGIWQFSSGHNERRSNLLDGTLRFCACENPEYDFSECWRRNYCFVDNANISKIQKIVR